MKNGPDMFFARVGKNALVHTTILPAAGMVIQKAAASTAVLPAALGNMPLAVLAPVLGSVVGAVRGLLPF